MVPNRTSPASARSRDTGNIVEHPANLQAAEISGQGQAGFRAEAVGAAVARQFGDVFVDARILPDERVGDRAARLAIPQHGGLALVGDADRGQVVRPQASRLHGFRDDFFGAAPDLVGVVLHPSGLRIDLLVFFLRGGDDAPGAVEHDESRAGGALVDGSDVVGQFLSFLSG